MPSLITLPSRNVDQSFITIYANRSARRSSYSRKLACHITTATSDIEAFRTSWYAGFSEKSTSRWPHDFGQKTETFAALYSTSNNIPFGFQRYFSIYPEHSPP